MKERATATNNRKKDAHHGTYMEFAPSRLLRAMELRTFVGGNQDDFFAVDVRRHATGRSRTNREAFYEDFASSTRTLYPRIV